LIDERLAGLCPALIPQDEVDLYAVRAQYERGWIFGEEVKGYREEENVAPDSSTETYPALKLFIDFTPQSVAKETMELLGSLERGN
jgi:glucose-6-phosphate 1-dehydrogenase